MRFYLNNLSNRVYVEVAPQITETFDETLDSATVNLKANDIDTAYAPGQYFYICDDNDNILYTMILALDMVETYSSKPLKYRHTLTLTQNIRDLSRHSVRNSVFTQPMSEYKKGYFALNNSYNVGYTSEEEHLIAWRVPNSKDGDKNIWQESINLNAKDKPYGDFVLDLTIWGFYHNSDDNAAHAYKVTSLADFGNNTNVTIRLLRDGIYTGQSVTLTNSMLNSKFAVDSFTNYIKSNPSGEYSLGLENDVFAIDYYVKNNSTCFVMQINYSIQTYYFNCYDLLDLLITRQQHKNSRYAHKKLFSLPTSGDLYDLLVGTIPPNFTFTANTMYECVADIFKLFDAIFTLDENNVLGIEYLNEYKDENTSDVASTRSTHAEQDFNRGLVAFYQDARVIERFPTGKGYAPARSSGLGVPTGTNDFCIMLPHNIDYIEKVEMLNPNIDIYQSWIQNYEITHGTNTLHYDDDMILDINSFVFESSMYGLLLSSDLSTIANENQNKIQANSIYYQKGDNKVMLGLTYQNGVVTAITQYTFATLVLYAFYRFLGLKYWGGQSVYAGSAVPQSNSYYTRNYTNIKTAVTYRATVDGKVKVESVNPKRIGDMYVDQSNGAVDLNKLGTNMFGLALKLGEPSKTKTLQIVDFANRIRKGQYIIDNGEKWIANVITHTILDKGKVQSVVNFVKNYNALSLFTRVNREKRMSIISSDLVNKSEVLFGEYIYFSSEAISYGHQSETKMVTPEICKLFYETFQYNDAITHRVDYAIINSYDSDNVPYTFNDNGTTKNVENVAIPLIRYGAGNTICLEASFSHPKSAGNKTTSDYQWWGGSSYFTNFVPYTDDNGFVDKIDYRIYFKNTESDLDNYPIVNTVSNDTLIVDLARFEVHKHPNEVFAINYQIHLLPIESRKDIDFVGAAFINNNAIVKNPDVRNFYIHISNSYCYSILDTKGEGTRYKITDVDFHPTNTAFSLTFSYDTVDITNAVSWAICDENGNIYFASNTQPGSGSTTVYFATKNERYEDDDLELYYTLKFEVGNNVVVYGNIGANQVAYRPGTSVELILLSGTPYHLYISFLDEHWYSDEMGWDDVSGVLTSDVNLGLSSSAIQMTSFTILWEKYIKAITIDGVVYNNPDPSDSFLYRTVVWSRRGLNKNWSVSDIQSGYYPSEESGVWNTNDNLYKDITAIAYRSITINFGMGVMYVTVSLDGTTTSYYNPHPADGGDSTVISNLRQGVSYVIETHPIPVGWETTDQTVTGNTTDGDVTYNATAQRQTKTLTASISGDGYIWLTYTDPDDGTSLGIGLEDGDEVTLKYGTEYEWDAHANSGSYISGTDSGSGTITGDTTISTSFAPYRTLSVTAGGNVTVSGTIYRNGDTIDTFVRLASNQTYTNSDLKDGDTYEISVSPVDSYFYLPDPSDATITGTINGDKSITTATALSYTVLTLVFHKGVQFIALTIDGVTESYYNPYPAQTDGGTRTFNIKQNIAYSWGASPVNGYQIDTGASGSGTTDGSAVTIEPTASVLNKITYLHFSRSSLSTTHSLFFESLYFENPNDLSASVTVTVYRYTSGGGSSGSQVLVGTYTGSTTRGRFISLTNYPTLAEGSYTGDRYRIIIELTIGSTTTELTIGVLVNTYTTSGCTPYLYSITSSQDLGYNSSNGVLIPVGGSGYWDVINNTWSNTHS